MKFIAFEAEGIVVTVEREGDAARVFATYGILPVFDKRMSIAALDEWLARIVHAANAARLQVK